MSNKEINIPGIGGTLFNINIEQEYFGAVDPIQTDTNKIEVNVFKKMRRQIPVGPNIDRLLLIKLKPNES